MAAVLLGPDVAGRLVRHAAGPVAEQSAPLPIGVCLVGPAAEVLELFEAGDRLENGPDPGDVGQLGRQDRLLVDPERAPGERGQALFVGHADGVRGAIRAPDDGRPAISS